MPIVAKYENRVGYPIEELGPGEMTAVPGTGKKLLLQFRNGSQGMGDPSVLYLKMLRRPGYVRLSGAGTARWWWGSFVRDSTQNHQAWFTFPTTMLDNQMQGGREDFFVEGELVTADFVWLA